MLRDKALAISMWEEIKREIAKNDSCCVPNIKYDFLNKHKIKWKSGCYFCQYSKCINCKLLKHESCYDYAIVCDNTRSKSERIASCDNIINALKEG